LIATTLNISYTNDKILSNSITIFSPVSIILNFQFGITTINKNNKNNKNNNNKNNKNNNNNTNNNNNNDDDDKLLFNIGNSLYINGRIVLNNNIKKKINIFLLFKLLLFHFFFLFLFLFFFFYLFKFLLILYQ